MKLISPNPYEEDDQQYGYGLNSVTSPMGKNYPKNNVKGWSDVLVKSVDVVVINAKSLDSSLDDTLELTLDGYSTGSGYQEWYLSGNNSVGAMMYSEDFKFYPDGSMPANDVACFNFQVWKNN